MSELHKKPYTQRTSRPGAIKAMQLANCKHGVADHLHTATRLSNVVAGQLHRELLPVCCTESYSRSPGPLWLAEAGTLSLLPPPTRCAFWLCQNAGAGAWLTTLPALHLYYLSRLVDYVSSKSTAHAQHAANSSIGQLYVSFLHPHQAHPAQRHSHPRSLPPVPHRNRVSGSGKSNVFVTMHR